MRYRGYVFDQETGLYYLQSRYYNPEVGRFINADAYTSTGQGMLGNNMFAYCNNNPVNRQDPSGSVSYIAFGTREDPMQTFMRMMGCGGGGEGVGMLTYYAVRSVEKQITKVRQDLYHYDESNTEPTVVFEANYFSCYYGTLVIKLPFDIGSFSFGIIGLGTSQINEATLNHELGHIVQLEMMKPLKYLCNVAIPSFVFACLTKFNIISRAQYDELPFEKEATELGALRVAAV